MLCYEMETSFSKDIEQQLRINNTTLINTLDKRFESIQTILLQTIKHMIQQIFIEIIVPKSDPNQQVLHANLNVQPPQTMYHPSIYPSQYHVYHQTQSPL